MSANIALAQPSPLGRWWTQDHDGVIEISSCGQDLCGRIVGQPNIRNPDGRLPRDVHGTAECGLTILRDAAESEAGHFRGLITNPDDGSEWHCEFWVGDDGALRLRGYIMLPLFGKTQSWPRFTGQVERDCRIN